MDYERIMKFIYEAKSLEDICFQDAEDRHISDQGIQLQVYMHNHFSPKINKLKMDYWVVWGW